MKFLILLTCLMGATGFAAAQTQTQTLDPQGTVSMKFAYVPHEASDLPNAGVLECTHERIRDLPDWKVVCGGGEKVFTAHVVLRIGKREDAPKTVIEILYWVTAPGETPTSVRKYHSTSALVYLNEPTDMAKLNISQGVENDMATLTMVVEKK